MTVGAGSKAIKSASSKAPRTAARLVLDRLILLAVILVAWEALAVWLIDPLWIGQPSLVAGRLWQLALSGELWRHAWTTLLEAGLGLLLAFFVEIGRAHV